VKGINQFKKEIIETKNMKNKIIDISALNRNEETMEVENEEVKNEVTESPKKLVDLEMSTMNGSPESSIKKKDKQMHRSISDSISSK